MTLDAVTPSTLTLLADRGVKQPDRYGSSAALALGVLRANASDAHVHMAVVTDGNSTSSVQVVATPQAAPPMLEVDSSAHVAIVKFGETS